MNTCYICGQLVNRAPEDKNRAHYHAACKEQLRKHLRGKPTAAHLVGYWQMEPAEQDAVVSRATVWR